MKTNGLHFELIADKGTYIITFPRNNFLIGTLYRDIDGFWVFEPSTLWGNKGFWQSWVLKEIALKMEELNKPWEDDIDNYFATHPIKDDIEIDIWP